MPTTPVKDSVGISRHITRTRSHSFDGSVGDAFLSVPGVGFVCNQGKAQLQSNQSGAANRAA